MTPARLLAHFDRIADAPNAVSRLRRFILDLSIRGKIVEQDPTDEPASQLLEKIESEKRRLVTNGSGRKEKPPVQFSTDDVTFAIPTNWRWTQLASVGILSPRNKAPDVMPASFVPMSMISADYGIANSHEIRPWGEMKSGYTHFAEGDVGLAKITPCFENGKSAIFRGLTGGIGAGTTELHVVRPIFVSPAYILIFLKSPHFIEVGAGRMTGTAGQKRVSTEYFAYSPFPLPPLTEQHRIVAKVDELMALCDRLEAAQVEREKRRDRLASSSLHRLNQATEMSVIREYARFYVGHLPSFTTGPDQIHRLRQTILNLAIKGKLVPQDSIDDSVESPRHAKPTSNPNGRSKPRESDTGLSFDRQAPFAIPSTWAWLTMADVFDVAGGIQKTPQRSPRSNAFPYLGVGNVYRGRLDLTKVKEFELREGELERWRLEAGDLLIIEGNGSLNEVGRCARWNGEILNCVHQNHIIRCRPIDVQISSFVLLFLNSGAGTEIMQTLAITSSGLYSLSVGKIRRILIPVPPLDEQRRIVAKVDELMAVCDRLESTLKATQTERRRLLEVVLHEALAA